MLKRLVAVLFTTGCLATALAVPAAAQEGTPGVTPGGPEDERAKAQRQLEDEARALAEEIRRATEEAVQRAVADRKRQVHEVQKRAQEMAREAEHLAAEAAARSGDAAKEKQYLAQQARIAAEKEMRRAELLSQEAEARAQAAVQEAERRVAEMQERLRHLDRVAAERAEEAERGVPAAPPKPPRAPAAARPHPAPAAVPTPPEPSRGPARHKNVRIDLTITDQRGSSAPVTKVVSMIVGDRARGSIRSQSVVAGLGTLPLHVDARPDIVTDETLLLNMTLEYDLAEPKPGQEAVKAEIRESLSFLLDNGKPLIVSQSADPVSDRRVTVEVKATVLK